MEMLTMPGDISLRRPDNKARQLELAGKDYVKQNIDHLNEFQQDVIYALFAYGMTLNDYLSLILQMSREVDLLERVNFTPYQNRGDKVVRPAHYDQFPIEPTTFNMRNGVDWCRGNVLKYISRYRHKNGTEDIRKAMRYLEMYVKWLDGDKEWSS